MKIFTVYRVYLDLIRMTTAFHLRLLLLYTGAYLEMIESFIKLPEELNMSILLK